MRRLSEASEAPPPFAGSMPAACSGGKGGAGGQLAGRGEVWARWARPRARWRSKSVTLTSVGKLRESDRQRACAWQSSSENLANSRWNRSTLAPLLAIELRREGRLSTRATAASSSYERYRNLCGFSSMKALPGRMNIRLAFCEPCTDAFRSHDANSSTCCAKVCVELMLTTRTAPASLASRSAFAISWSSCCLLTMRREPPSHRPPGLPSDRWK